MTSPGDEYQVVAALNLSEGITEKFDLTLEKLYSLDSKMEDLNTTVKSLQSKLSFLEIDIVAVKDKQKNLEEKFTHMEANFKFVDECISQLQSSLEKSKKENLKFKGITEAPQNNATSTRSENTKDAKNIEFQRIHRLGKPKNDNGDGGQTIIARFLRFSDRERVFKLGRKLKGTNYRMFEDIPKELHQKSKLQMGRLKEARKEGRHTN